MMVEDASAVEEANLLKSGGTNRAGKWRKLDSVVEAGYILAEVELPNLSMSTGREEVPFTISVEEEACPPRIRPLR